MADAVRAEAQATRAYLSENIDVPKERYENALALREEIAASVDGRLDYVNSRGLDPAFCLPDGNWNVKAANDYIDAYRHVRSGNYDVLNRLKFFAQFFSGYNAMTLEKGRGLLSVRPVPPDLDAWIDEHRSIGTLDKQFDSLVRQIPDRFIFRPPLMCGEHGWKHAGTIINYDTLGYQERLSLMYGAGLLKDGMRILEIGGGYGALARALSDMISPTQYVICDLPESLMFSGMYLTCTTDRRVTMFDDDAAGGEIVLVPNYRFTELKRPFDLVINTISMAEMTTAQVETYATGITRLIGATGSFYEQNSESSGVETANTAEILPKHFAVNSPIKARFHITQGPPMVRRN